MFLGLDFSENLIAAILADEGGKPLVALRAELPHKGGASSDWLAAMDVAHQAMLQSHAALSQITSTHLAFYAPLDENGVVLKDARAPGWSNYDLPRALREHLKVSSAFATHRVLCEAVAEERLGALRAGDDEAPLQNWLYLHLGASLEAAARANGVLVRGANNCALDLGALCIERGGALSENGKRGALEAYCGGDAFVTRTRSYGLAFHGLPQIWEAAATNAMAKSLCDDYIERLAQGVGAALSILNPSRLVIGGEMGHEIGEKLIEPLRLRLPEYSLPRHVENLEIVLGQLGRDAAVVGAVSLARNGLK